MVAKRRPKHANDSWAFNDEPRGVQSRTPSELRTTAFLMTSAILLLAISSSLSADQGDENETAFAVADVFFELNDTDGDLGLQALIDGEPWQRLEIENPGGKKIFQVRATRGLAKQGLNEIFFESAEPGFDELPPDAFLARFPEGVYEVSAKRTGRGKLESEVPITHLLPAPPANIAANGQVLPLDCEVETPPTVGSDVTVTWDPVDVSHPEIGMIGVPIDVELYEVVVENEALDNAVFTIVLGPDQTSIDVPSQLIAAGNDFKLGLVAQESSGNRTVVESCFAK
ncbi:MAG: hypothetical protein AAFO01_07825 [Pseudomonadota bacterium]